MRQTTNTILMVRPAAFGFNVETAVNNSFQSPQKDISSEELAIIAQTEFDSMVLKLQNVGVQVIVVQDTAHPTKPDAVFPNNWFSTHEDNIVITYPMFAANRRLERREDIIALLESKFIIKNRYSFDFYEEDTPPSFLEGTGSMIIDRINKIVYACISQRTELHLLDKFNVLMQMKSVVFDALDREGQPIYHTNVMMALGEKLAIVCLDSIKDETAKNRLINMLKSTNKKIVDISYDQMDAFAGNMLEVIGMDGTAYTVMSETAYQSLTTQQKSTIEMYTRILPIAIPHIEKYGGGSVRCMMAEIFLQQK